VNALKLSGLDVRHYAEHRRQPDRLSAIEPEGACRVETESMAGEGVGRERNAATDEVPFGNCAADLAAFLP
jgi:hypothetical protein